MLNASHLDCPPRHASVLCMAKITSSFVITVYIHTSFLTVLIGRIQMTVEGSTESVGLMRHLYVCLTSRPSFQETELAVLSEEYKYI